MNYKHDLAVPFISLTRKRSNPKSRMNYEWSKAVKLGEGPLADGANIGSLSAVKEACRAVFDHARMTFNVEPHILRTSGATRHDCTLFRVNMLCATLKRREVYFTECQNALISFSASVYLSLFRKLTEENNISWPSDLTEKSPLWLWRRVVANSASRGKELVIGENIINERKEKDIGIQVSHWCFFEGSSDFKN